MVIRAGNPDDVPAVPGMFDGAVAWPTARGVSLLRVDCHAGDDGGLVAYYESQGLTGAETFTVGEWPGQVLELRIPGRADLR